MTVTSVANTADTASAPAAVTDLAGVYTYHNDLARDGVNSHEFALTPSNVNTAHFGKLTTCPVDGVIFAQPLWVANVTVNGAKHDVVYVATEHDSLFAFDADAVPCTKLWSVSLIDTAHGATAGEIPVLWSLVGFGLGDIQPEVGITSTPVIDPTTNILYAIAKSTDSTQATFYQRVHAIDITTGNEKAGAPLTVSASFPGSGDGGSTVAFNPQQQLQRSGLALANGVVYAAWSAHEDKPPYYGWMMGYQYSGSALVQTSTLNVSPNAQRSGIWMSGGAPSVDSSNRMYVISGNGSFDVGGSGTPNNDYGDSLLQLNASLGVAQYFTPSDQLNDAQNDGDFGSGGATVLVDLPAGNTVTHALICGGKDTNLYVINRDMLGGFGDQASVQETAFGNSIYATGAFWNNSFFLAGRGGALQDYQLNPTTVQLSHASSSSHVYGFPGATPSVTSSGTGNGIVWTIDSSLYCTETSPGCAPALVFAHDATNVANELWDSSKVAGDAAAYPVKFSVPTIANGRVYIGTRGTNTGGPDSSTSNPGELDVYGLKP